MISPQQLLELYTVSCAPLGGDTLLNDVADLSPSDFTASAVADELQYLTELSSGGFHSLSETLAVIRDQDNKSVAADEATAAALIYVSAFCKRMATLSTVLSQMSLKALEGFTVDATAVVKALEIKAKLGSRPSVGDVTVTSNLRSVLDFTPNVKWEPLEPPPRGKVGFKTTMAVISEGGVEEKALDANADFRRKKHRNPTGYHKFTFKDLGLGGDSDGESDSRRSMGSDSARTRAGGSTDGGSTRGSISHGALTSGSASSGGEDYDEDEVTGRRAGADRSGEEAVGVRNPFESGDRSSSSVAFSFDRGRDVIQDEVADPMWEEQTRHERRFSRIRNRVPTGHPSLMKRTSDELADLVNDYERQLSSMNLDETTAENTEANKVVAVSAEDAVKGPAAALRHISLPPDTTQ